MLSFGKATRTVRNNSIHSRSCRIQDHGSDQSNRTTRTVFGIDCGVRIGLIKGAKDGEGLVRRYIEMRASISAVKLVPSPRRLGWVQQTLVISVQEVIVCISKRKLICDGGDLVSSVKVPSQVVVGK